MSVDYCPICYLKLETAEVAPCHECGHLETEVEHAKQNIHSYAEMRIFGDLSLILCDFCQVDFGSYHPEFFGLPPKTKIGFRKMQFLRSVDDHSIKWDKVCPNCHHRVQFLEFVNRARELHQQMNEETRKP
ncbi:MAG TPA: hypothetical protein VIL74_17355 [Pyrinomonadaceae bacterium]|jgi:hypothetical protein